MEGKIQKGIPVIDLIPGCHAERAGVQVGDYILSVNGKEINDMNDYVAAIRDRKHSQKVTVERNGEVLEIEMAVGKPVSGLVQ